MDRLTESEIDALHKWLAHTSHENRVRFARLARSLYAQTGLLIYLEVLDICAEYALVPPSLKSVSKYKEAHNDRTL